MHLGVKDEVNKFAEVLRGILEKYNKGLYIDEVENEYFNEVIRCGDGFDELVELRAFQLGSLLDMLEKGETESVYALSGRESVDEYVPYMLDNIIGCLEERDDFCRKYVFITSSCAIGEAFVKEHELNEISSLWYDAALVRILDEDGTHLEVCIDDKFTRIVAKEHCFDTLEEAVAARQECLKKCEKANVKIAWQMKENDKEA